MNPKSRKSKAVRFLTALLCLILLTGPALSLSAAGVLTLGEYFTDNAVLQCDMPVRLTGSTAPGKEVTAGLFVEGDDVPVAEGSVTARSDGSFTLVLPAQKGSYDVYELEVTSGSRTIRLKNLLFGEVWLTAGQSNMQYKLGWTADGCKLDPETEFCDTYLRGLIDIGPNPVWTLGDTPLIADVTAIGYYFASELRETLDVPVAVIDTAAGGSSLYEWVRPHALEENEEIFEYVNPRFKVGLIYDIRIGRLAGMTVRGMLWYQGENNWNDPAGYYSETMRILRADWGDSFGWEGDTMPLIVSHIAPHYYGGALDGPARFTDELNAIVNEAPEVTAQVAIYDQPVTYASDAGHAINPIHPSQKLGIGKRMAASALSLIYGAGGETTSPVFKSLRISGNSAYITFDHVGDGLAADGKELKGFAISAETIFVPAHAEVVSKDTVKVTSPYVRDPVAVSYAWTMMNMESNLVSTKNGEPLFAAVPFRTLDEKNVTYYPPHDWTYCDDAELWHSSGSQAEYVPQWKSGSGTVSFDAGNAARGEAALKLDYTADSAGKITVSPVLDTGYPDEDPNYSHFRLIRFLMKTDGTAVPSLLRFTDSDGVVYEVPLETAGEENGWTIVRADVDRDLNQNGKKVNRFKLRSIKGIDFIFEAASGASGVLYLDDFILSAEKADEPTPDVFTDVPEDPSDTDPSGETKENAVLVPVLIGTVAVLAAAAVTFILLKNKKKSA